MNYFKIIFLGGLLTMFSCNNNTEKSKVQINLYYFLPTAQSQHNRLVMHQS